MGKLFSMGIHNLLATRMRSFLTVLGLALGVALILAIQIGNDSLRESISTQTSKLYGASDIHVAVPSDSKDVISDESIAKVSKMEEVKTVLPSLKTTVQYSAIKAPSFPITGVDISGAQAVDGYEVSSGKWFTDKDSEEILLNSQFAQNNKLQVGDSVTLTSNNQTFHLKVQGLLSSVGAGNSLLTTGGIVPVNTAQKIVGGVGANQLSIILKPDNDKDAFLSKMKSAFPGFLSTNQKEDGKKMQANLSDLQSGFLFLTVISIFLSCFIIFITFSVTVSQRMKEIGTFRALGATRGMIINILLAESSVMALIGSLFGIALGIGLGYGFLLLFSQTAHVTETSFHVSMSSVLLAAVVGFMMTVVSSIIPIWDASKCSPMEAFGQVYGKMDSIRGKLPVKRSIVGCLFVGVGTYFWFQNQTVDAQVTLVFTIVSIIIGIILLLPIVIYPFTLLVGNILGSFFRSRGKFVSMNIRRMEKRTSMTITLVVVAICTIVGLNTLINAAKQGWVESYKKEIGFDLVVYPKDTSYFADDTMGEKFSHVEGVAVATPYYMIFRNQSPLNKNMIIIGAVTKDYFSMFKRETSANFGKTDTDLLYSGKGVAISENVAKDLHVDVGGTYTLTTGDGEVKLPIASVYKETSSGGYSVTLPEGIFKNAFKPKGVTGYYVTADSQHKVSDVVTGMEKESWGSSMRYLTTEESVQKLTDSVTQMFVPFNAISVICIVVAMLGMANTLLISIMERKREIGVLRSIGADKSTIRSFILMEGGLIGAVGLLVGYPIGFFLGYLMVTWWKNSVNSEVVYTLPIQWLLMGIIVTFVLIMISSILPARKASKMDVIEALQ